MLKALHFAVLWLIWGLYAAQPTQILTTATGPVIQGDISWYQYPYYSNSLTMVPTIAQDGRNTARFAQSLLPTTTATTEIWNQILLNKPLVNESFRTLNYEMEFTNVRGQTFFARSTLLIDGDMFNEINTHYVEINLEPRATTIWNVRGLTSASFVNSAGRNPNFEDRQLVIQFGLWIGLPVANQPQALDYMIYSIRFDAERLYRTRIPQCERPILEPNINILSRYIPDFTKLDHRERGRCTFVGFTAANDYRVVFKDIIGTLYEESLGSFVIDSATYPTDLSSNPQGSEPFLYGANSKVWSLDDFDAEWKDKYINTQTIYGMIDLLRSISIRGINLYSVLEELACQNGIYYPIAVVGGAIRDYLVGQTVNDIDIAISIPYSDLVAKLQEIFVSRGAAIDDTVLVAYGVRKQYGLIKVSQNVISDPDALDIGPMKSGGYFIKSIGATEILGSLSGDSGVEKEITQNFYSYGYSYATDAASRDYTVNAIYMEVFGTEPKIIDVYGSGIEDNFNLTIRPIDASHSVAKSPEDLGGLFRYFKLYAKGYRVRDTTIPEAVCLNLNTWLTNAIKGVDADDVLYKLTKKLFKNDITDYNTTVYKIRTGIIEENVSACIDTWNYLLEFCKSEPIKKLQMTFNADNNMQFRMNAVINQFREFDSIPKPGGGGAKKRFVVSTLQTQPNQKLYDDISCVLPKLVAGQFRGTPNEEFGKAFGEYYDDAEEHPVVAYPKGTDFQLMDQSTNYIVYVHQLYLYATYTPSNGPLEPAMQRIVENNKLSFYAPQHQTDLTITALGQEVEALYRDEDRLRRFASFVPTLRSGGSEKDFADIIFRAVPEPVKAHRLVLFCRLPSTGISALGLKWNSMRELPKTIWLPSDRLPSTNGFNAFLDYVYTANTPATLDDDYDKETFNHLKELSQMDTLELCSSASASKFSIFIVLPSLLFLLF